MLLLLYKTMGYLSSTTPESHARDPSNAIGFHQERCSCSRASKPDLYHSKNGHTPLHYACAFIHQDTSDELVKFLLARGADVNAQTFWGNTPLNLATGRGSIGIVKHLLQAGATINGVTGDDTALHVACERGYLNLAKELVRLGADPNALGFGGVTPIYSASAHGKLDVVDWLLSLDGIQFDTPKRNGCTPLFAACQNGHVDTASRLIQTGAKIQTRNIRGSTPLGAASANGHDAVVQRLLRTGADMDAKNNAGASPIHLASRNGFSHVVGLLLDNGANIDGQEISVAFENGHFDTCRLLVIWLCTIGRLTVTK